MTAKKKPAKRASGGARLTQAGYKPILLRLTPEQHERIRLAAEADKRPMTTFIEMAIEKFLEKEKQK